MSVETLMHGINKNGVKMLLNETIQASFAKVMKAGVADAKPEELDWQLIVDNWSLPFEGKGGASDG